MKFAHERPGLVQDRTLQVADCVHQTNIIWWVGCLVVVGKNVLAKPISCRRSYNFVSQQQRRNLRSKKVKVPTLMNESRAGTDPDVTNQSIYAIRLYPMPIQIMDLGNKMAYTKDNIIPI